MPMLRAIQHPLARLGQWVIHNLRTWITPYPRALIVGALTDLVRTKQALMLENALLRQQLIVMSRQRKRPKLTWRDRALFVVLASRLETWKTTLLLVKPETVLRWHRDLFRQVWRRKSRVKIRAGRPSLALEYVALIRRLAKENIVWGTERIRGELLKLGLPIARSTIQKYLKGRRGAGPGSQTWTTFLRNHASAIWACDFLQTHDFWFRAIFVFVIIEHASRRVVHVGVTYHPSEAWVTQQLREATAFGEGPRFLIRDNDGKYGTRFDQVAAGAGVEVLHTPIRAPRANALCKRFLGSLRRECLDFLLILSERHLRLQVTEYVRYFNHARPHQGLAQAIPVPVALPNQHQHEAEIVALPVLYGLHHDYQRRAA
jgi:putative transposase